MLMHPRPFQLEKQHSWLRLEMLDLQMARYLLELSAVSDKGSLTVAVACSIELVHMRHVYINTNDIREGMAVVRCNMPSDWKML